MVSRAEHDIVELLISFFTRSILENESHVKENGCKNEICNIGALVKLYTLCNIVETSGLTHSSTKIAHSILARSSSIQVH